MATVIGAQSRWRHRLLLALLLFAAVGTGIFALRVYGSLQLLRSAYAVGAPAVRGIRPWMTLHYVAGAYRAPETALVEHLGLPRETPLDTSLRDLAEPAGLSRLSYVQRVQRAVAEVAPTLVVDATSKTAGGLGAVGDQFLAALLAYGYPILGLTLLLGAIGLPLPSGLATVVAGSLAAQGQLSWVLASTIAVTSSVAGDMAGYALGRVLGRGFLERRGGWLGYTPASQARAEWLFERWGVLTVLRSRTLVSHLSSVANLLAGVIRYRFYLFLALAVVGRLLWTSAYMGLGYAVGGSLDAADAFLKNLTGLLV